MTCIASANLDVVKSIAAAWRQGDYSCVEWADADVEFVVADGPEPGSWTGREDLGRTLLEFRGAWEEYHSEVEEYFDLDDEGVFVLTYVVGRGKASGVEMSGRRANVFRFRDGKVTSLVVYWNRARALADLGLAPEAERP
jgi:ketosteroid isomerase-like protein